MILFGGFKKGEKRNDLYQYNLKQKRWQEIQTNGQKPSPRSGMTIIYNQELQQLIVFAGKDENNNRMNDIWYFDLTSNTWTEQICLEQFSAYSNHSDHYCQAMERSGHTAF